MSIVGICGGCEYNFFTNCFCQIFAVMCPFAVIVFYLSMTSSYTAKERLATAKTACWVAWSIMVLTALGGPKILAAVGVAMEAFNIAGGLMLVVIGFGMLRAEDSEVMGSKDETEKNGRLSKKKYLDVAIAPLAVPIVAGPGTLAVILANRSESQGIKGMLLCLVAISLVIFLMYAVLVLTSKGVKWLTPTVLKLGFRLSGLFLVALGVQFVMNGLREIGLFSNSYVIASLLGF